MSNMAGGLFAGLGMNMQRRRWFTIARIKGQWMKSLARCTVIPVRPGTSEDEYNTSSIGQSSWSRTSCSMSRTAMKTGFLWVCHIPTALHDFSSLCASPQYLQLQFPWSSVLPCLKAVSCARPSITSLLPSWSFNCQLGWRQYALLFNWTNQTLKSLLWPFLHW